MTNLEELQSRIASVRKAIQTESSQMTDTKKIYELRKAFLRTYGVPDNVTSFHGSVPSVYCVLIYKYRYSFFAKNLVPTGSSSAIL